MIKFGESGHTVFRATSPLSRGTLKSKGGGKLSTHFCADGWTIETVLRTIISVNQLSLYGAVSDLCEEYKACHVRTERPVLAGQSDPLFVPTSLLVKTPTPSTDDPAQEDLFHKYQERVARLSQQNRVIKVCPDAGFLTTVGVGQYFMTKHTDEFSQFTEPVTCREYTLPRDEKSSDPQGWIRGNTKIEPVLEVTTSYLQGKYGVEIRIESVNKDNSHSWVRISHGMNKLVTDLSNKDDDNEQETSEMKFEEFALKTNVFAFASRSKAKAKPRRPTSACSSTRTLPIGESNWTDIEPETYSPIACTVSKQLSTLLRHGHLPREEDGAIEFWRLKEHLRNEFEYSQHWSDEMWKSKMAGGGGNKKRFQYCTDPSGQEILYLRALQGHSGRNPIDLSLQDSVLIPNNFFEYIYHIGCAINLHSTNSGFIPGGQTWAKDRQYSFCLWIPWTRNTKILMSLTRKHRVSCMVPSEKVEETSKHGVFGSTWNLLKGKDLSSIKHDRPQSSSTTLPAYCIPKVVRMELEKSYTRRYMRHLVLLQRFPWNMTGWKNWVLKLLVEVKTPTNPTKIKTPLLSTEGPVKSEQPSRSLTQKIEKGVLCGCESTNVSTGDMWRVVCQCLLNV